MSRFFIMETGAVDCNIGAALFSNGGGGFRVTIQDLYNKQADPIHLFPGSYRVAISWFDNLVADKKSVLKLS